jgi:UPF0271 protein
MISVDLNCDMGEGMSHDAELMPYISSANIACGFHAGDSSIMQATVSLALKHGVAIGAHPSFPDKENFGRTNMTLSGKEIYEMTLYQIGALHAIAKANGTQLHHVKPHGALYNMAALSSEISNAIVKAIHDFDRGLILYGLASSEMIKAAQSKGLAFKQEVFADRTYQSNGTLTSRSQPNALIEEADVAVKQVMQMVKDKTVTTIIGERIPIQADTICIHGDGAHAVQFAKALHAKLKEEGISIASAS